MAVDLRVWEGLWHVFEFYAEVPEASQSLAEIARFLAWVRAKPDDFHAADAPLWAEETVASTRPTSISQRTTTSTDAALALRRGVTA